MTALNMISIVPSSTIAYSSGITFLSVLRFLTDLISVIGFMYVDLPKIQTARRFEFSLICLIVIVTGSTPTV